MQNENIMRNLDSARTTKRSTVKQNDLRPGIRATAVQIADILLRSKIVRYNTAAKILVTKFLPRSWRLAPDRDAPL